LTLRWGVVFAAFVEVRCLNRCAVWRHQGGRGIARPIDTFATPIVVVLLIDLSGAQD
jgi:hypothetical protein